MNTPARLDSPTRAIRAAGNFARRIRYSACALLLASGSGLACAQTWTGLGADNNWSTSANWSSLPSSGTTTALVFAGTTRLTPNADSPFTAQSIVFNSTAGAFTLSGSQLSINGTGADANGIENQSASLITINNSLRLLAASQIRATGGDMTIGGAVDLNGVSAVNFKASAGKILKMNGIISGNATGTVGFNSGGTIQLNADNTYTATTTQILNATVVVGVNTNTTSGAFGNGSSQIQMGTTAAATAPTILLGGTYTFARGILINTPGTGVTTATLGGNTAHVSNFTGTIQNGVGGAAAQALTLTAASGGRVNFTASIIRSPSGTGTGTADTLTKTGLGTVALSGTGNNWQGITTVQQGTLLVNGTILGGGGAVTVNSAATLGGFGTVNRDVNILSGGVFSTGDLNASGVSTAGTLAVAGNLTFANTSLLKFDLGAISDSASVTGNLTLDGILDVTAASGFGVGTYTLLSYTGTFVNNNLTLNTLPSGYNYALDVNTAGQVNLIVSAIPEPASIAAILGGCGLLAAFGRRRRSSR
ncbi:MAG: PEP-CTERM sorting domain-containing protein [Opitutaceae bacterium]|jgi:autotransporter-associated beta strand protein